MSVVYGLVVGTVVIGRYVGSNYTFEKKGEQGTKKPLGQLQCIIMFLAFFLLSLSNRTVLVFLCYFAIGFASSSIGSLVRNHKNYLRKRYRQKWNEISVADEMLRMNILSFITMPLLAGLFFSSSADSLLPALWPCALISLFFLALIIKNSLSNWIPIFAGLVRGRTVMESIENSAVDAHGDRVPIAAEDVTVDEANVVPTEVYLQAFKNDKEAAKAAYISRLKWKKMYGVDNILTTPQKFFDEILENYPHAIHGRSKDGCAVVYELIGQGNPKKIIELGMTPDTLVWHFNLRNEYILRRLSKTSSGPSPRSRLHI